MSARSHLRIPDSSSFRLSLLGRMAWDIEAPGSRVHVGHDFWEQEVQALLCRVPRMVLAE